VATIVDQAIDRNSDLLVMGTHGRSGVERLLGSVTDRILRKTPCPVLTVPPHLPGATMQVRLFSIVCPVDFSPASLQAVGFALDLARRAHARVTLLHAIEWLAEEQPPDSVEIDVSSIRQALEKHAEERLQALLAQEAPVKSGVRTTVVVGRAHRKILHVAHEDNADLIVMGAQGHSGIALALLGSTTEQVVRAAPCPVLTMRAPLI
jgi:nucleotide-binding universal stress UspA family protein